MFTTCKCFILDEDECSRGSSICPTNSFCRNTPGSYVVCELLCIKRKKYFFFLKCDCISGYKMSNERAFCEGIGNIEF
jgi:hypothetical protein